MNSNKEVIRTVGYHNSVRRNCQQSYSVIENKQNKITKILYGHPKNPLSWPSLKSVEMPERYLDVTETLFKYINNNVLIIPSGYRADHTRIRMIKKYQSLNFGSKLCTYKEIVIVRENGSRTHFSKWDKVKIIF